MTALVGDASTRLIVIRGNSGSGKSTLAAAIRKSRPRGIAIVGQDQLRREILHVPDQAGLAVGYIDLTARFALDHGLHVIIEGILQAEIYGGMLRRLLDDHRGVSTCYRYDVTFAETLRRHATKGMKAEEFGRDEMRSWWQDQDPLPGVAEKPIAQDSKLPDTVRMVLTDCRWTLGSTSER